MTSVSGRLGAPCLILDLGLEGPRREQGDFSYNGRHQPQTCFLSIGGGTSVYALHLPPPRLTRKETGPKEGNRKVTQTCSYSAGLGVCPNPAVSNTPTRLSGPYLSPQLCTSCC